MPLTRLSIGPRPPHEATVVIEIPAGGEPVKYELDKSTGVLTVDRILGTAMRYPGNYGFIPQTLGEDGDPLDVLIVSEIPLLPGSAITCRPIGVLRMSDEAGGDEKILAVPAHRVSRLYDHIVSVEDLGEHRLKLIAHFFEQYKSLEAGKWVRIDGWGSREEAHQLIVRGLAAAASAEQPRVMQPAGLHGAPDRGSSVRDLQAALNQKLELRKAG